jgi:hypothetical protein
MQKRAIFVQVLGRQGFPRLVLEYAAQGNPQSDDEIAKKRRFWTRTGSLDEQAGLPVGWRRCGEAPVIRQYLSGVR